MSIVRGAYAAPNWANSQRVGDVGTKATLMLLAAYADENFSCFPGQELLAEESEQSVRTVRRQLDVLEEVGLISREPRYAFSQASGKRVRTSDRFQLHLDAMVTKTDVQAAQERIATGERTKKAIRSQPADLPASLSGRSNDDLSANLSGRFEDDLPANLAGTSEPGPTGQIEPTYRPNRASSPDTGGRVTPRGTPRKINTYVTSTSEGEVEAAAGPVDDTHLVAKGLVEVNGNEALDQVDADELERIVLTLPDRLRPTAGDATRLRDLVAQRMRRGWTREDILEAVDRRLRPGALDNPCGLFAKTLVPLDEAPPRRHLILAKPWCGQCDERTRRPFDDLGFPDATLPKCGDCEQLVFTQHMERGAS